MKGDATSLVDSRLRGNDEAYPAHAWIARLRAFARPPAPVDRCELCGTPLPPQHTHLVEPAAIGRLLCTCTPCALLFDHDQVRRYKRVPRGRAVAAADLLGDEDWAALDLPIGIVFFFWSSSAGCALGFYPGAAGLVQAQVDAGTWARMLHASPALATLAPDVEAVLVNRLRHARECWRLPIDRCYELAGLIRREWRGMSGGDALWQAIDDFFGGLRRESRPEALHA